MCKRLQQTLISEFYSGLNKYYVANGNTLVDALTASILAQEKGVVLVNEKSDNKYIQKEKIQYKQVDLILKYNTKIMGALLELPLFLSI